MLITKIVFEGLKFKVDETGHLLKMINKGKAKNVSIPSELPGGIRINSLACSFCGGSYLTITISNDISVETRAFYDAEVDTVVWPSSCKTIPAGCFMGSSVSKVLNIDSVETAERYAFEDCARLEEFTWPSKCKEIPEGCFYNASLKSLSNIDHVESVVGNAFGKTALQYFRWPDKCKVIPDYCFVRSQLKEITNISNVEEICDSAFDSTCLTEFNWPPKCDTIPAECFKGSPLESIWGIQQELYRILAAS